MNVFFNVLGIVGSSYLELSSSTTTTSAVTDRLLKRTSICGMAEPRALVILEAMWSCKTWGPSAIKAAPDSYPSRRREKIYCYLCQGGRIEDVSLSIFIDSGGSFNAIAPAVAESLKLQVATLPDPLRVKLGGGQRVSIPRRTTSITVSMEGFPDYATEMFVMEIPEGKNVMLGFPWLEDVNPDIDWSARIVRPRGSSSGLALQSCPRANARSVIAGARRRTPKRRQQADELDTLFFYAKHNYMSYAGKTKIISHCQFRRMRHDDEAFCFVVRVSEETSDKAARQLNQGWEQLRGRPEESVIVKYKNTVFRAELPSVAPQRSVDVEAEVELSDDTPVERKQFRLSDAMKEAIRAWTIEMLEAGIIRPSKSPYCAPTFCVKKAVGWRIVHDFRGINSKLRIPATPVPRKEDI
ncbi:hypothetical protein PC129_g24402 [Phytophthora cactorum]|uniref:Aspartic peptidase domain n=1 Tax=Phytophthora cactorum TaxID=29920 RepID=A0A8T1A4X6_9STRA|nr:hypothetical protein PC111_g24488 [Phytophthora cactorum]KAG2786537.1 hypothetical protein PC112_g24609 [Phytophthora cactorum]KAG2802935.1 hypothetical protein PC113_g24441 [Phytophthora cactorum]KAG2870204.1 hypothetical protein PC114_g27490 [Phytophthora cactorum]KAG2872498.1 hypothetical protein PC115_g24597 [Phytophthora cactorum]